MLIATLRDRKTSRADYRSTTEKLGWVLAAEAAVHLSRESHEIRTPLCPIRVEYVKNPIVLVPILRAGAALLPSFMRFFDSARVGFIGMKRDEATAIAHTYYCNLPPVVDGEEVIVLEPMIATGGSTIEAIALLLQHGIREEQILFVSVIAATPGLARVRAAYPKVRFLVAQEDPSLNEHHFIVPGLGDFGDRYYGTEDIL
jgi:uracil phosphoribosyltransferase